MLEKLKDENKNLLEKLQNENMDEVLSKYDCHSPFVEGMAMVGKSGLWGFIDLSGEEVISIKYGEVRSFSEGLACAMDYDKWGFIDKTGKEVIPLQYDHVHPFKGGIASVEIYNEEMFYINKVGEIVEPSFLFSYREELAIVSWISQIVDRDNFLTIESKRELISILTLIGIEEEKFKSIPILSKYESIVEILRMSDPKQSKFINEIQQLIRETRNINRSESLRLNRELESFFNSTLLEKIRHNDMSYLIFGM